MPLNGSPSFIFFTSLFTDHSIILCHITSAAEKVSLNKPESIITDISELFFLASRGGAAVHTSVVQLADRVDKKLDVQEASQVDVKYALLRPDEVSHQKQLDGYITVDQPVRS